MRNVFILGGLLAVLLYLVKRASDAGELQPAIDYITPDLTPEVSTDGEGIQGGVMADIRKWAEQIMHFEGGKPGDRNMRNNNPGNLKYNGQPGATKGADNFAVFPTQSAGMDALVADLSAKVRKYPDYSILQIMTRYLGGDVTNPQVTKEGNPFAYAASVAKALGVSASAKLSEVFG